MNISNQACDVGTASVSFISYVHTCDVLQLNKVTKLCIVYRPICCLSESLKDHIGQITKVRLSYYQVCYHLIADPGNKTAAPSLSDSYFKSYVVSVPIPVPGYQRAQSSPQSQTFFFTFLLAIGDSQYASTDHWTSFKNRWPTKSRSTQNINICNMYELNICYIIKQYDNKIK